MPLEVISEFFPLQLLAVYLHILEDISVDQFPKSHADTGYFKRVVIDYKRKSECDGYARVV